jgi:ABC-type transporter Mla maintaining outer membrane lipid asymmetry ATPase subunit MlaF
MAEIIELKNVCFSSQDRVIVQDFSCQFEEGKITALIGPSGSGKSTVLKLSAGILVPNEGEIYFRGMDIFDMNRQENLDFRREAAMVFQDSALWANQSLYQTLELPLRVHFPKMPPKDRDKRIMEVLAVVGYKRDLSIRPDQLSMGEQKLIGFARALMCHPKLLFLDEWVESLDESNALRLIQYVQRHQKEQNTAIFVCHDFRIVRNLADHIILIKEKRCSMKVSREQIEANAELARYLEQGIA